MLLVSSRAVSGRINLLGRTSTSCVLEVPFKATLEVENREYLYAEQ
jgi:hypothetical protein